MPRSTIRPCVDDEDLVGVAHGRQPVGDHQRGTPGERRVERPLHRRLGLAVQVGGRLVEHDDRGALSSSRAIARRCFSPPRAGSRARRPRCRARRAAPRPGRQTCAARSACSSSSSVASGLRVQQVLADRLVEHVRVLGDEADRVAQRRVGHLADVDAADQHRAVGDVVEPRDEVGERRLAGARRSDQRDHLAGLDARTRRRGAPGLDPAVRDRGDLEARQRDLVGASGSRSRRARNSTGPARRRSRPRRGLLDHRLEVEHLEDPLEGDQRGHHVDPDVGQRGQRAVEAGQQRGQRDQVSDGDAAADRELAADAVDERGRQRGDEHQRAEEDPADHRDLHADVAHARRTGRRTRAAPRPGDRTA